MGLYHNTLKLMKDEFGIIYEVTDPTMSSDEFVTVRNIKTNAVRNISVKKLSTIEGFRGMCASIPKVGERHTIFHYEGKKLRGCVIPEVKSFFKTAEGLLAIITTDNIHICQLVKSFS